MKKYLAEHYQPILACVILSFAATALTSRLFGSNILVIAVSALVIGLSVGYLWRHSKRN